MKANEFILNRFLSQADTQFIIPVYQRNYDWEKSHCKQLIDDILKAGENDNIKSHFIGSIVYIHDDVYSASGIRELTIIDGQQRLTTVTLIYIALLHLARKLNNKQEDRINKTYLINEFAESEKLKLRPTDNNDKALKFLLTNPSSESYPEFSQLIENYYYLKSRITEENYNEVTKGLEKLIFVDISLERDKDNPQRIFESLNSTGLELSQADLIRNYILMGLKPKEQTKIYAKYWEQIERLCTSKANNLNHVSDFIRDFLTIKNRTIPNKNRVYQEFKEKYPDIKVENLEGFLSEIKTYAGFYNKLINSEVESNIHIQKQIRYI